VKIIIVGAGKVGYTLAESLADGNNDVTVIDKCITALKKVDENLDVLCIKGSGVSMNALLEAGVKGTDLLIAVTDSDEVNMVCCLTAKKLGAVHTAARIRDPQYAKELIILKEEIDIDLIINPEYAAADEIVRCMSFSPALNVESFAKDRVKMIELKITPDMPISGSRLKDEVFKAYPQALVGVVLRDNEVVIPDGEFEIKANDILYVIGKASSVYNFCNLTGQAPKKYKNVMILGGGKLTHYLTNFLIDMGMKVKIIEMDSERCIELSEALPRALIVNGDGTDEELLQSENMGDMDAFVAVTGIDEQNLLSSLLAKQHGVKKVVSKISRMNYTNIAKNIGIDNVICPKLITSNQILKYVNGNKVESLYTIIKDQAEIIEFIADGHSIPLNKPIKTLALPKETIIATIVRKNEIVIPRGSDVIKKGDRVIIITKTGGSEFINTLTMGLNGGLQHELLNGVKKLGDIINL